MNKTLRGLLLVFLLATIPVLAQDEMLPDIIEIERTGMIPEGIEYDAEGERFLVGSLTEGTIFQFDDDGELTPFVEDEDLISTIGIHIDTTTNRLLVTNTDASIFFNPDGAMPFVGLAAYDLETSERLFLVDMTDLYESPIQFANDVTSDEDGNAYVTNSMAPVIYQVTPDGEASIFVENELFMNPAFGLNGIEYHPHGYLLAAVTGAGAIYKIPLDDPDNVTLVETEKSYTIDGMAFDPNLDLVMVASVDGGQAIVMLASSDDWASADERGRVATDGNATTVAIRGDTTFYTKGYFNNPAQEIYDIHQVTLQALMMDMDDMDADMDSDDMGSDDMDSDEADSDDSSY